MRGLDNRQTTIQRTRMQKNPSVNRGMAVQRQYPFHKGGKRGIHTEHLGYILADMQFLQRAYPNSVW